MATVGATITRTTMKDDGNSIPNDRNPRAVWFRESNGVPVANPQGAWNYFTPATNTERCAVYLGYKVATYSEANYGAAQSLITASTIVTNFRELAKRCTRFQYLQHGAQTRSCTTRFDINFGNRIIARDVENASLNSQIDTITGPATGSIISASALNAFVTNLNNKAAESLNIQNYCDHTFCHCSCHSSCHASRARR